MPKNEMIKKVLVVGSGPITIGQAAEFDYSGTQACQALKEEGVEVVLINSNPATIMTDKEIADKIYIEPLNIDFLTKVIEKERPDSLLAGMGGQTALNLSVELFEKGILDKYNVNVIGTSIEAIKEGEDRDSFKKLMQRINMPVIQSSIVTTMEQGINYVEEIGYPVIIRPAYTLGGTGGGIAENKEDFLTILDSGLSLSPVNQVLIEKSIKGWKEIEYEVIRDSYGNCITVCNMENVDPVGIHTGDSIVVAPSQTLSDVEYQLLRTASIDIINEIKIQGGCNVQLALNPESFEYAVIEINPRVSRSSALASKATGYPIAKVATKIALGYALDEIENAVTKKTYACFEPSLDYVVVKIPKWPFDKFYDADRALGTKMMATGEIMSIGRTFEEAFLKGIRSLEINTFTFTNSSLCNIPIDELTKEMKTPDDQRIFYLAELLRRHYDMDEISKISGMDMFFINKFKGIIELEEEIKTLTLDDISEDLLLNFKKKGFSDKGLSILLNTSAEKIYNLRKKYNIFPSYKMVDTCAGEFEALSPYYYSSYDGYDEVEVSKNKKVLVIGSGPIRIGQGIEFDYCCVHCVLSLKKLGLETIIVNNNPETVSTDFNISDKLYFEPLTEEDVFNIIEKEKPYGVVLQFGGQTGLKLAKFLKKMNVNILGTPPEKIDEAEDRELFDDFLEKLDIKRPKGKAIWNLEDGLKEAEILGYPVLVRPSYVIGGQGMEITHNQKELTHYIEASLKRDNKNSILLDRYLLGKEIEVDALCDGENILIPGIMEHLERSGVHSGDSISIYPSISLSEKTKNKIYEYTKKIALKLKVIGMINIQFIEYKDELYVIEVNPRSSRTVPYISKVTRIPIIDLATKLMLGDKLNNLGYGIDLYKESNLFSVKVPVFSTQKLPNVEVSLGPEMKSTGEVLGVGKTFKEALYKGFIAADTLSPIKNNKVLCSINDYDKAEFLGIAKTLNKMGFDFLATKGTHKFLTQHNIKSTIVKKVGEGSPDILDTIKKREIDFVIDTPTKGNKTSRDGFRIRRTAIESYIKVFTCLDTAKSFAEILEDNLQIKDLDIYNMG
ncbi:MAG: carbamoyl-phosphate synthase large subunit [Clostridiaceae bacterium]